MDDLAFEREYRALWLPIREELTAANLKVRDIYDLVNHPGVVSATHATLLWKCLDSTWAAAHDAHTPEAVVARNRLAEGIIRALVGSTKGFDADLLTRIADAPAVDSGVKSAVVAYLRRLKPAALTAVAGWMTERVSATDAPAHERASFLEPLARLKPELANVWAFRLLKESPFYSAKALGISGGLEESRALERALADFSGRGYGDERQAIQRAIAKIHRRIG